MVNPAIVVGPVVRDVPDDGEPRPQFVQLMNGYPNRRSPGRPAHQQSGTCGCRPTPGLPGPARRAGHDGAGHDEKRSSVRRYGQLRTRSIRPAAGVALQPQQELRDRRWRPSTSANTRRVVADEAARLSRAPARARTAGSRPPGRSPPPGPLSGFARHHPVWPRRSGSTASPSAPVSPWVGSRPGCLLLRPASRRGCSRPEACSARRPAGGPPSFWSGAPCPPADYPLRPTVRRDDRRRARTAFSAPDLGGVGQDEDSSPASSRVSDRAATSSRPG